MVLTLERKYKKEKYSIGNLYIDGVFFCNTLEDTDRGLNCLMNSSEIIKKKVYGSTAVPYGTYRLKLAWSPKFRKVLPRLHSVPGFEGILIHSGNTIDDTSGCILIGNNTKPGMIINSRECVSSLITKLKNTDNIVIDIVKEFKNEI